MKSYNTRKNITLVSLSLAAIFAFALANADDYSTKSTDTTTKSVTGSSDSSSSGSMDQQAGKAGSSDSMSAPSDSMSKPQASAPSTCTDSNGVLYRKGSKGFDHCLQEKPSSGAIEQQGGTSGMNADKGSVDSSTSSGASAPSTSGTSDPSIHDKSNSSSTGTSQ